MRSVILWKRLLLFIITLVLTGLWTASVSVADITGTKKHVLILNSYHEGFTWTREETEGILDGLNGGNAILDISVEYMDWKNFPNNEHLQILTDIYAHKYSERPIDLIIATDDAAFKFSLEKREELFFNAPVVFCGVNEVGVDSIASDYDNYTGILEQVDIEENIRLAIEAIPGLENIYVLHDNTESAQSTGKLALDSIKRVGGGSIKGHSIQDMTYEEVLDAISHVPEKSAVYIVSFYVDKTGKTLSFEQISQAVSEVSKVPVFNLYDFTVGHGALGGSMLSGRQQGEHAAELALRILSGEPADSISVSREKTSRKLYDYHQLVRFNIPLSRLDKNSEIINKPFSFFDTYKALVISVLGVIVILTVFILMLVIYIRRLKKAEKELQESHGELSQLYIELAVSREEIEDRCNELAASQEMLNKSDERYRLVLDGSNDMLWDVDLVEKQYYFSDRWFELMGYDRTDNISFSEWNALLHPEDAEMARKASREHLRGITPFYRCEYRLKCKNGEYKWFLSRGKALFNAKGRATRFAGSLTDIDDRKKSELKLHESYQELEATYEELFATQAELNSKYDEMKDFQDKLRHNAYHDALTGLPNRLSLYEDTVAFLNDGQGERSAYLYIDSDNFKFINDTMGHSFGDQLITAIGRRLASILNDQQTIYRLGGDEFVVTYRSYDRFEDVEDFASEIICRFNAPFEIGDSTLYVTASIGISIYPEHGSSADEILQHADIAMYRAKSLGKNKFYVYNHYLQAAITDRMSIEKNLRGALQNHEFLLYFQPQLDLERGRISGFEALLRWNNPELGMVSPLKFISIAEETHLIISIGQWVLEEACLFLKRIHASGHPDLIISVNVSITQLLQEDYVESVLETLEKIGLDARYLELEITESVLMQSYQTINAQLRRLKDAGIKLALDDFGQGYSSLSYLKQLPINTLKIDKSFIDSIKSRNPKDNFIDTIVMIGRKMGLVVLAEGVEHKEQMDYLAKHKCHKVQGYFVSRPVPEEQAKKLLDEWQAETDESSGEK